MKCEISGHVQNTEAVVQRCSVKKVFLDLPHTCNFIKKETLAQVLSYEFCEVSKNTFSDTTPPVANSGPATNSSYFVQDCPNKNPEFL